MLKMMHNVRCPEKRLGSFFCNNRYASLGNNPFGRVNQWKRPYCLNSKLKRFEFHSNNFHDQNKSSEGEGGKKNGWGIYSWLAVVTGIAAYLLINKELSAAETDTIDFEDRIGTKVTKKNFGRILDELKKDNPSIHTLEFEFVLREKEVNELAEAVKDNTELGYVGWHENQITYKGIVGIEKKLVDNNKDYRSYPNDYVHGLLSKHAYKDSQQGDTPALDASFDNKQLQDWRVASVHSDTTNSGYYSAIYINDKTHQVVLAVRGTEGSVIDMLKSLVQKKESDWGTNIEEILGGEIIPGQQKQNFEATEKAITIAKEKGYRLSFTGHSLGAWLAELSVFYSHAYFNYQNIKAVTFDSPGTVPMMNKLQSNTQSKNAQVKLGNIDIVTYLAGPNPANSCNGHVGRVYRVNPKMKGSEAVENSMPKLANNTLVKGFLSIEGHFLDGILLTFDPATGKPKACINMLDWPKVEYVGTEGFSREGNKVKKSTQDIISSTPGISVGMKIALNLGLEFIGDKSIMPIVGFLKAYIKGDIQTDQFWTSISLIDIENGSEAGNKIMNFDNRFALLTLGHYRKGEETHVMKLTTGSVDEYLFKLDERRNKLNENKNIPLIIKDQLEDILSSFEIKSLSNDGKTYVLVAKKGDEETIRERMQRLLMVVPKQARDLMQINTSKTVIHISTDVEIRDRRSLRLPNNLPLEAPFYVEISDKRNKLEEKLEAEQIVVLSGPAGMGKSTLATKYGRDTLRNDDEQVIWIEGDKIEENFLQLAKFMKIVTQNLSSDELRDFVYGGLFSSKPVLLIFDQIEKDEKIERYLKNLPNNAKVIITSRNDDLLTKNKHIKVEGFSQEDSEHYLDLALKNLNRKVDTKEIKKLQNVVGESPFRLVAAIAYLKQHNLISIKEYIQKYRAIAKDQPGAELLLRGLKNPGSKQLLNYLVYLDSGGIGAKLITKIMGEKTFNELNEYIKELKESSLINVITNQDGEIVLKVSHKIVEEETQQALSSQYPEQVPIILNKLIQELDKEFPDIENNPQKLEGAIKLVNHVRLLVQSENDIPEKENLLAKIGYYDSEIVSNYKDAIPHFEKLLQYRRLKYKSNDPEIAKVLDNLGKAYIELGGAENLNKGLKYQEESLKIRSEIFKYVKETYGDDKKETAEALDNLGKAHLALGDKQHVSKALKHLEASLQIKQSLFFGNHSATASSLYLVGKAYQTLGGQNNILKGLDCQERSLQMRRDLSTTNGGEIAALYDNIGLGYQNLGGDQNIRRGIKLQEESLAIKLKLYSELHPEVATSLRRIGIAYAELREEGDLSKGIESLKESLQIRQKLFPGNHAATADLQHTIGILYGVLNGDKNAKESLNYLKNSLDMWQELEKSSPNDKENELQIAILLTNTGQAYQKLGNKGEKKEGLKYIIDSLNARNKIFRGNHADIATALNNVGIGYLELEGEENYLFGLNSIEEGLKMRQELFLGNHLGIAESLNSMAKAYEKLGDNDKALEYRKQAMSVYQSSKDIKKEGKHYSEQDWDSARVQSIQESNERANEEAELILSIQLAQPKFFTDPGKREKQGSQTCFGGNNIGFECRWMITERGDSKEELIRLKQKIQKNVLSNLVKAVEEIGWSKVNWRWVDEGVKGYLEESYLKKEVGTGDSNQIKMAKMLCFESMNLGIMKSEKKPYAYEVVQEFTKNNPELVKEIAKEHPEFFVDGSIAEACIKAMAGDEAFQKHILKHVRYMGVEARMEGAFENQKIRNY